MLFLVKRLDFLLFLFRVPMSESHFFPLPSIEYGGAVVVNVFALLSTFALFSVACRVIWLAFRQKFSPGSAQPKEYIFFNTQLGYYAICLLIGNMFTDVSGLVGWRWTTQRGITEGSLCTFQAVLMQIGNWSIAYFTVTIAVHTFNSLVLQKRQSVIVSSTVITIGWITSVLLAAGPFINPGKFKFGPGYGADGLSCGVRAVYPKAQFFFHLFPIFVASVLSAILYSLIFLVLRGTLNINGGIKLTLDPHERWVSGHVTENYQRFVARIARSMLWYPVGYIILLVPYSITRLLSISGFTVAFQSMIFAYTCWFMLGIVNVLLLYNTFRVLEPAFDSPLQKDPLNFESGGMFERYEPALEKGYAVPPHRSPTIASFGGQSSPRSSIRPLLPVHKERSASMESYYSYPSSPSIGRAITPINELHRTLTPPEPVKQKLSPSTIRSLGIHTRQESTDSLSLPAAPRRTRSPVLHQPSMEQMRIVHGSPNSSHYSLPRQSPTGKHDIAASPRIRNNPEVIQEYNDPTSWESRHAAGTLNDHVRPLLSAVNSNFGSPVSPATASRDVRPLPTPPHHSRSFSAAIPILGPAPTGRQRAVLPSRHGSIGNTSEFSDQVNDKV